jgi:tRNA pseudouridine55 synthase
MDGILNVNKPAGITSFDVVAMVRRLTKEKRVGHAGTLDPMATGVLPVCVGQATRLVEYLVDTSKAYRAEIELGLTTDTYDMEGQITQRCDVTGITQEQLTAALLTFLGPISQMPPMYSAVKHHGQPLYKLARAGVTVERKARSAMVYSIELTKWQAPVATVEIVCGKGTYIRAIANDVGNMLGCGASLKSLTRLYCGIFRLADAVTPAELEEACRAGYCEDLFYPMDSILAKWPAVIVGEELERFIRNGNAVSLLDEPSVTHSTFCRAYTGNGFLLGVLRLNQETGLWHPDKVFVSGLTASDLCDTNNIRACRCLYGKTEQEDIN